MTTFEGRELMEWFEAIDLHRLIVWFQGIQWSRASEWLRERSRLALKYVDTSYTISFDAPPKLLLAIFLLVLTSCVLVYLILEVGRAQRDLRTYIRPHSVQFTSPARRVEGSFGVISASIVRCKYERGHPRRTLSTMSWLSDGRDDVAARFGGELSQCKDPMRRRLYIDKLTALTPSQFVRLDKEERMRALQTVGCMRSLTTLFNSVAGKPLADADLRRRRDAARDECSLVSHQLMQYLDSERVTDSLIDALNEIIDDANAENPLPEGGDLVALICDIGSIDERPKPPLMELPDTSSSTTITEAGNTEK